MKALFRFPDWVRRLHDSPRSELTRWQRAVRLAMELGRYCAGELRHDDAMQMAAALAFHTLFSLLPMAVLALVTINAFVGEEDRQAFKEGVVNWAVDVLQEGEATVLPITGPPTVGVDLEQEEKTADDEAEEPALPGDVSPGELVPGEPVEEIAEEMARTRQPPAEADEEATDEAGPRQEFERVRERLDEEVSNVLDRLEQVDIRSIGIVGVLLFLYGATALLATMEESFNTIFGTQEGRPWYIRLPVYYTLVTLGPVVLVGAQVLQSQLFGTLAVRDWTNWLVGPIGFVAPIFASWLVLFLLYVLMPHAAVSKGAAAIGGLVGAVLWVITKDLFALYVSHGVMGSLYGALALMPLFLFWLWATWLIILFGLELTFTLQAMRGRRSFKHQVQKQPEDLVFDPAVLLPLATHLAAAFERGEAVTLADLGQTANLPPRIVRRMMTLLEEAHIVHPVLDTVGQRYTLARPADRIRADEVLAAAEKLLPSHVAAEQTEGARPAWQLVQTIHHTAHRVAGERTLASLLHPEQDEGGSDRNNARP